MGLQMRWLDCQTHLAWGMEERGHIWRNKFRCRVPFLIANAR